MGNSGSMHNIDIEPFTDYSHNFHHHRQNENEKLSKYHNSIKWTQSYPLEGSSSTLLRSSFVSNDSGDSGSGGSQIINNHHYNYRQYNRFYQQHQHQHQYQQHHHHHFQQHPPPPPPPHQPHFKVLPDLNNESPQLRNTTNGAILHSGGTISGRKQNFSQTPPPPSKSHHHKQQQQQNQPPLLLQRSRTSIDYDLNAFRYNNITRNGDGGSSTTSGSDSSPLNNHRHTLSSSINRQHNFQRSIYKQEQINHNQYGSSSNEIDTEKNNNNSNHNNNNNNNNMIRTQKGISKAEKIKNKKRKAPDPPSKDNNTTTTLMRIDGRQSSSQELKTLPKENYERKSRLFKTKAESRKNLIQDKSTIELSDNHYNGNLNSPLKGKENILRDSPRNQSFIGNERRFQDKTNLNEYPSRPTPPFPFRREKSFDITLLTAHNRQRAQNSPTEKYENSLDRLSKQRLQPVGSVNDLTATNITQKSRRYEDKLKNQNTINNHKNQSLQNSSIDKKFTDRKLSQPNFITNCDFKKELQEVTKRRSIALEYMERKREQQQKQQQQEEELQRKVNSSEYQKKNLEKRIITSHQDNDSNSKHKNKCNDTTTTTEKKSLSSSSSFTKKNLESKIPKLIKTFYFGMELKNTITTTNNNNDPNDTLAIVQNTKFKKDEKSSQLPMMVNDAHIKITTNTKSVSTESALSYDNNDNHHFNHKNVEDEDADDADDDNEDDVDNDDDDDDDDDDEDSSYQIGEEIIKNENNGGIGTNDIQIHVRPTLPRRQLEVPQFSPSAAWRMLNEQHKDLFTQNSIQRNLLNGKLKVTDTTLQNSQQQQQQPIEEKIHRIYREPIPMYLDNKSRDSGISGDGGQQERISDTQENHEITATAATTTTTTLNNNSNNNLQSKIEPFLIPWTPQQDLEGETSSEGEMNNKNENFDKYPNYSHLFSLSLPRESHLSAVYAAAEQACEEKQGYSSLLKLKRRLSEALTNIGATPPDRMTNYCNNDNNWLLSRSVTNSIDNTRHSLSGDNQDNISQDDKNSINNGGRNNNEKNGQIFIQPSSLSYLSSGGKHGMYLPQNHNDDSNNVYSSNNSNNNNSKNSNKNNTIGNITDNNKNSQKNGKIKRKEEKQSMVDNWNSRKYERNKNERESLQDPVTIDSDENKLSDKSSSTKSRGGHRYTFQSAVRQIERRRIAEKLSKEAEQKEAYRLSELEAMRRVEEDFQRKRAKEKASIRQQWRMFSLDENRCSSLPFDWQITNNSNNNTINHNNTLNNSNSNSHSHHQHQQQRTEPEGAVSGATTPSSSISLDNNNDDTKFYHNNNNDNNEHLENDENILSPTTKILSEFHTLQHEYLDYHNNDNNNIKINQQQQKHHQHHQDKEYYQPVSNQILSKNYQKSKPI